MKQAMQAPEQIAVQQKEMPTNLPHSEPTITYPTSGHLGLAIQRIQSGKSNPLQMKQDIMALQQTIGNRAVVQLLAQVQKQGQSSDTSTVHTIAAAGVQGSGSKLPHYDKIQASFGSHDVSHVQAYTESQAAAASRAIGAQAYATGIKVAFADSSPSLHTAAHEAAHIIQQQAGVHLKDGVGEIGDSYEQHADRVADAVVQGKSAETILNKFALPRSFPSNAVQQYAAVQRYTSNFYQSSTATVVTQGGNTLASEYESNGAEATNIAPADYDAYGSGTSPATRTTSQGAKAIFGGTWVAGHLLNEHLGGPGNDYKNITAFTGQDNSAHLHNLEKYAKGAVISGETIDYFTYVTKRADFNKGTDTAQNLATELKGGYKNHTTGIDFGPVVIPVNQIDSDGTIVKSNETTTGM